MNTNDFKQQLIDKFRKNSNQDESQENIVHLTPKQAQKKYQEVIELLRRNNIIELHDDPALIKELDEQLAIIFRKYPDILTIQDEDGYNLGMFAAIRKLEKSVIIALDNFEASVQQDKDGWNIGMFAVNSGLEQAALKSMENKEACKQKNRYGETIESLYQKKFGKAFAY